MYWDVFLSDINWYILFTFLILVTYFITNFILRINLSKYALRMSAMIKQNNLCKLETFSILWAWGDPNQTADFALSMEKYILLKYVQHPEPRIFDNMSFLSNALIAAILLYQRFLRVTTGHRQCVFWPNCSNYAIGMLRRHSVKYVFRKTILRIKQCDGSQNGFNI